MRKKIASVILSLLLFFGLYLRLRAAAIQSFWGDEASILLVARNNSLSSLILLKHWDKCHPQLFYIMLHFWQKISTDTFFLRLPSLITFIPAALFLYQIGKKAKGYLFGILIVLLFSTNHFFVNLGFQQKPYAFELMFMFGTIYFLQELILSKFSKKNSYLFILFAVCGFYTDYSFTWLWASIFTSIFVLLITKRISKKTFLKVFKGFLIATSLMLTQIIVVFGFLNEALGLEAYLGKIDYDEVRHTISDFMGLTKIVPYDLLITVILNSIGLFLILKNKKNKANFLLLITMICFYPVVIISYLISQKTPIFLGRNIMASSFIFVFLPAYFASLSKNKYIKSALTLSLFAYVAYILPITLDLKDGYQGRDPWKEVHRIAKNNPSLTVVVITNKKYAIDSLRDYYFGGLYDGHVIKDFNEKWISRNEKDSWINENDNEFLDNVVFLADPDFVNIEAGMETMMNIHKQVCTNRKCHGIMALQ